MGLRIIEFLDPFSFLAASTSSGEIFNFSASIQKMNNEYMLSIHEDKHDFYVIVIEGKKGDNAVLLTHNSIDGYNGKQVSFEFISSRIKKKWRYEFT